METVIFNQDGYVNFTFGKAYQSMDFCPTRNAYLIVADDDGCRIWAPVHLFRS
jgi:hypothetical protein